MSDKYTETILALNNRLCEAERQLAGVVEALKSQPCPDSQGKTVNECINANECGCDNKQALANLTKEKEE